jgi:hypothetical protein
MRLYLLYLYENKKELPEINTEFIRMAFKAISKKSKAGRKPNSKNTNIYNDLNDFYVTKFINIIHPELEIPNNIKDEDLNKIINDSKLDASNLSYILKESGEEMFISITNNIKYKFVNYINLFVNQMFKEAHEILLSNYKGKYIYEYKKKLKHQLYLVKNDLLENTKTSNEEYHEWIDKYRQIILPTEYDKTIQYDVEINPNKYLKYMIKMNRILEQKKLKTFQFFSIRSDITCKYIKLNTDALVDLFYDKDKSHTNISKYQDITWASYFNILDNKIKYNGYTFNYEISTDGYAVSILFIKNEDIIKKQEKKNNMANGRRNANNERKNMTSFEKEKNVKSKKEQRKVKEKQLKDNKYQLSQKGKEKYKKSTKEEKEKIKLQIELNKKYPYIEYMVQNGNELRELINKLNTKELVYGDPGKRSPLYLYGENGKYFNYTNRMRLKDTRRLKYGRMKQNLKNKTEINNCTVVKLESSLSDYNSKSCKFTNFTKYILNKLKINKILYDFYNGDYFKKLRWYSFLNKNKHENNLINLLRKTYGDNSIFIIGDWDDPGRIKYISTPNKGILNKMRGFFKIRKINEFNTSKLHHKYETETCKMQYIDKIGIIREVHSVLMYKSENNELGCINRDKNAVLNMKKIVHSLIKTGKRPEKYTRVKKTNSSLKSTNRKVK